MSDERSKDVCVWAKNVCGEWWPGCERISGKQTHFLAMAPHDAGWKGCPYCARGIQEEDDDAVILATVYGHLQRINSALGPISSLEAKRRVMFRVNTYEMAALRRELTRTGRSADWCAFREKQSLQVCGIEVVERDL